MHSLQRERRPPLQSKAADELTKELGSLIAAYKEKLQHAQKL